ncbi:MAG: HD-GYP domain-containing protein [Candidatus Omnitrophota bacterium]
MKKFYIPLIRRKSSRDGNNPFVSYSFKLWIVGLIFFLVFVHVSLIWIYPNINILPKEIILGVVLVLSVYLWIQELRDRYRLLSLNKTLLDTQAQLEDAEVDTIATLILTEEAKDPYVCGHSNRVAKLSVLLAREIEIPKGRARILERAGKLHDLGKIGIQDEILGKRGQLTPEEWEIIKQHPRRAVDILKPLKFLVLEKGIILHHHERYDGKGYPDGIKGEEIPLEARILSIADTFDAMNSARAYRQALSRESIMEELKKVSGSQLDPRAVEIFLSLLEKDPSLWEKDTI